MELDLKKATILVEDRPAQLSLIWGCIIGFFKKLPVKVYEGDCTLQIEAEQFNEAIKETNHVRI